MPPLGGPVVGDTAPTAAQVEAAVAGLNGGGSAPASAESLPAVVSAVDRAFSLAGGAGSFPAFGTRPYAAAPRRRAARWVWYAGYGWYWHGAG